MSEKNKISDTQSQNSSFLNAGLNMRAAVVLREVVEKYLETGEPVGSAALSKSAPLNFSSATVRHIMADLTRAGLLFSPHTSAGRLPTERGLRLFIDGILQFGEPGAHEKEAIDAALSGSGQSLEDMLNEAGDLLAGLSTAAGIVAAPKMSGGLKHIEFVPLGAGRAMVILINTDGGVENRIIEVMQDLPPSALIEATNYVNARLHGQGLKEVQAGIAEEIASCRMIVDSLVKEVVEAGLAIWSDRGSSGGQLIIRGRAQLLSDQTQTEQFKVIQELFDRLEAEETLLQLLQLAEDSDGVRIFIGQESGFFNLAGISMIVAPSRGPDNRIVGAIGVVGPTRLNYGRIIPVVDHTARVIAGLLGRKAS